MCFTRHHFLFSGEIDRCLKKISEGVEQFEDVWQKVSLFVSTSLCVRVRACVCSPLYSTERSGGGERT